MNRMRFIRWIWFQRRAAISIPGLSDYPESEMQKAEELEKSIGKLLDGFGNDNVAICTLLKILNKKLG